MKKIDLPIIIEISYSANPEIVWSALTEIVEMRKWYFENIPDFRPEVGFETEFVVKSTERIFTHCWRITNVVQEKSIAYSWRFLEYPGMSNSRFELIDNADKVTLKLTVTVEEDFPDGISEFTRESCINGWNYLLGTQLKNYLIN